MNFGISDVLDDRNLSDIENRLSNVKYMVDQCRKFGVKNILTFDLAFTTRVPLEVLEKIHEKPTTFCSSYDLILIIENCRGNFLMCPHPL